MARSCIGFILVLSGLLLCQVDEREIELAADLELIPFCTASVVGTKLDSLEHRDIMEPEYGCYKRKKSTVMS